MTARCSLQARIGAMSSSEVFRAQRDPEGAAAVVRLIERNRAGPAALERFRHEYALLQSLDIAGLAKPVELIEEAGRLMMVFNAVAGAPLDTLLASERWDLPRCLPRCLSLARQMAHTLAGLHARRLILQDMQPAHWMVDLATGTATLLDLNRASVDAPQEDTPGQRAPVDWAYLSPEQTGRMNRAVDYRTDLYSLGITLYQMLTGRLPFVAHDALAWAHCHIARWPVPPHELQPDIPRPVSDIVMKLLAKLPEDRYQSAHGLRVDLDHCLAQWQASGQVPAFALATDDVSDQFRMPHKLYGREPEIAALRAAFDRVTASGQAALVTVSGYAGIGKSSLVGELHSAIVRERGAFISGKFDPYQRDVPYATLTQAFRELVQQLLADTDERIAHWRQQIEAAVGVNGQLIVDILPQLELIIGRQAPVPALAPTESQNRFRQVLQQFIAVFARRDHPLVLFLDDVQWVDDASLHLLEHLLTRSDTGALLLIAAYRENEVGAAHALRASLDLIRHGGAPVVELPLAPPSVENLNQWVADALHAQPPACQALTRLIADRTEGNPFFFAQFLDALHKAGLLRWDETGRRWQWDLREISTVDLADNVADLMVGKLRQLPVPAQEALQRAACLGTSFELRQLARVGGYSEAEAGQRLAVAAREGLIVHRHGSGKFLHDRIQQAAYRLIPEERLAEVHHRIGHDLLASMSADELTVHLFDVANQFNRGAAVLADVAEKVQVATLDLRAGGKAKASAAYAAACAYFTAGMALLDDAQWHSQYALMFALRLERAECAYLTGDFDSAEHLLAELLQRAASKVDQAAVYHLKVQLHVLKSENPQAVASALVCLHLFGIDVPAHPTREQVQQDYEAVWRNLAGRPIAELNQLPLMSDPELQSAMRVLAVLLGPAYFTDFNLYCLFLCRMVNLSLQHGTAAASAHAYGFMGVILGPVFHRYLEGYQFARLAGDLVERHGFIGSQARIHYATGLVGFWTQPVTGAIDCMRAAFRSAQQTGELAFACYSLAQTVTGRLLRNDPLDAVWRESEKSLDFARQARFRDMEDMVRSQQRFIAAMQGRTTTLSTFSDTQFDEAVFESQLTPDRMATMVCFYWILKLQARFLAGEPAQALVAADKAAALLWAAAAHIQLLDHAYYTALALAALPEPDRPAAWRERLTSHLDQLSEWAHNHPPTFRDKHALVAAEIARLDGREPDAMRLYEQAIHAAHENGFVLNEGLAHELAAAFYRPRGFERFADASVREARSCYARWGAGGKVRQLEERHPQSFTTERAGITANGGAQLDMLSIAKATQAISGRIVLDELVDALLRIVLENAGAQRGALLLARNDGLVLAAEASVEAQAIQVQLHGALAPPESALPASILNYVQRSRERVLLADATQPHAFSGDAYFASQHPKSLLCLPIIRQSALIGLLYLENRVVPHAFTLERMSVLDLLAAQAAISLENALLYADLQKENLERRRAEASLRERDSRIRRLVESNIIGVAFWNRAGDITEANDAFLALVGYSRQDLLRGAVRWTDMTPPDCRAADARAAAELQLSGQSAPYEKAFFRKTGERIPVLIGNAFLEGSREQGVAFVLDLTERQHAEAERQARRVAELANQAKSRFLTTMSHELRTPLNAILGFAQLLQADPLLNERQARGARIIRQGGEQLLTLINDILDLSRIEAGKVSLNPTVVALAGFLRTIVDIISIKADEKGLLFTYFGAPGLVQAVLADERLLRQVLLNLLSNAVKFTERGQVSLRVHSLGVSHTEARLRFEVEDSGIGIPADELAHIFEPFEQSGDVQRRFGGTGLGLSISRQLVRLMGGEIQAESREGQGSRFWFDLDLPLARMEVPRAPMPGKRTITGYHGARRTLLVVDDVAANRALLVDFLTGLGFNVTEAHNGEVALQQAQAHRPDLVVMDSLMPVMDGLEATRRLRRTDGLTTVPVIAVSASASAADAQRTLASGANTFLTKPLSLDQLLHEIGTLLDLAWAPDAAPATAPTPTPTSAPTSASTHAPLDDPGPLVPPPPQELNILYGLAQIGNMRNIRAQADHLGTLDARYAPFARRLRELAEGYQSQAILALLTKYAAPQDPPRHDDQSGGTSSR